MNPSVYKDDFNHFPIEKTHGMLPTTTDAMILPSQAYYNSTRSQRMIKKPKPKLDDTFVRLESELKEKQEKTLENNAADFYLQTPNGERQPDSLQTNINSSSIKNPSGPGNSSGVEIPSREKDFQYEPTKSAGMRSYKKPLNRTSLKDDHSLPSYYRGKF